MTKRDIITLGIGAAVVIFLLMAPEETTPHMPVDDIHAEYHRIFKQDGKKAAEKFCKDCHGKPGLEFSPKHPDPNRCLFCHKPEG
ncbi:MAG: cytochrome c [Desulfuromonadaceae bacterium]|nr:cytochrome c [Desulfuromonas sp.]MDY0184306.1 cytochrome c [Desulfuromonadaceae bacterium]